tara:strand:- start:1154 stop:1285 length:132 start_codon:yes stop_codon:yes gene_type:complete
MGSPAALRALAILRGFWILTDETMTQGYAMAITISIFFDIKVY